VIEDQPGEVFYKDEDPFLIRNQQKRERAAKQKRKERANMVHHTQNKDRMSMPGVLGISNTKKHEYSEIKRAVSFAQKSTASLGYFDEKLGDEPKIKRKQKKISCYW